MRSYIAFTSVFSATLLQGSLALPAPAEQIVERGLADSILNGLGDAVSSLTGASSVLAQLTTVTATSKPTDIQGASWTLSSICQATPSPTNIYGTIGNIVAAGLTVDNVATIANAVDGLLSGEESWNNTNPIQPAWPIYPQKDHRDVVYDISEKDLRAAIYIPDTFQYGAYGAPNPIILVPGTGDTGYGTFLGNYIPLLQGSSIADPVWLNIPINLLSDAQNNAEFVAYAINYITAISNGRQVSIGCWSQGNIDSQWAFKFWPSIREVVTDHIAFSPDYHGTVFANFVAAPGEPLPPAILQQEYNSKFITALRANDGDSAFVPTTTVYSGFFDEIVEPQQGTGASAYLLDARGVGVTNNEVQLVCAGQAAGTFYTHEGILYNPLGYYLLVDALANDGPGQTSRLNLGAVCNNYLTPGLDLADFFLTETWLATAGANILLYPFPVLEEPDIKPQYNSSYAASVSDTYTR
ncbi:hypothetical protein AMS68_007141 [Peltaster fructicola]|uniref:Alpha/beta-hydrolase n=1 Tax=Peltaster fructicola TaxID=286661 RepID=A0A6H0Y3N1_9PEZI|nr:hypothetical protein AMS68_007141 [Peltaster fructicola]